MGRVILVRHGRTEWNRIERFRGRADVPLDETGIMEAKATGGRIAQEWNPVAVYSSPLSRAVKSAEAIARNFGLPVRVHSGLNDIDYGQWQSLTPDEVRDRWAVEGDLWYTAPHRVAIPGGETLADVRASALDAVNEITAHHEGQVVVIVAHTVVNRVILLGVLGLGNDRFWKLRQDTSAINVFDAERGDFTLVLLNDTCHLCTSG
ncbi:MAG: histidine phosphatase family protein [Deltaproteobacteria bacterium]|nr:histidine phosphatase family protein [Deltaproteobacteria bacterium]